MMLLMLTDFIGIQMKESFLSTSFTDDAIGVTQMLDKYLVKSVHQVYKYKKMEYL